MQHSRATVWLEHAVPSPRSDMDGRSYFLLRPAVSQHMPEMMTSRDIARLCSTTSAFRRAAADLVRVAMGAQHGVYGDNIEDLRSVENIPAACKVDLRRAGARTVERGRPFCNVYVGSLPHMVTQAQSPACGDEWSLAVPLRRGRYKLVCRGWLNPAHGILDLSLDGERATPSGGFDWSGPRTVPHLFKAELDVAWSGVHRLVGRTSRTNADRPRRFWICLRSLSLRPSI